MDIIFKGRRTEVHDRFRRHASVKLGKIGKLDPKAIRVDVEVSAERNPRQSDRRERVELTIRSRGPVIRAEAAADDRYAALDRALAKLEERMRRNGDRRKTARHGLVQASRIPGLGRVPGLRRPGLDEQEEAAQRGQPAGQAGGPAAGQPGDQVAGQPSDQVAGQPDGDGLVPIEMEGDGPVVVREKNHHARPMSVDQALLEMELVGHDFYLFRDERCGLPSVVYRRHGYQYGLIRLKEEARTEALAGRGTQR